MILEYGDIAPRYRATLNSMFVEQEAAGLDGSWTVPEMARSAGRRRHVKLKCWAVRDAVGKAPIQDSLDFTVGRMDLFFPVVGVNIDANIWFCLYVNLPCSRI